MGGAADEHFFADDVPRQRYRKIVLAEVQDVGTGSHCEVGPIVDREECAVATARGGQHSQGSQLRGGLQRPVALFTSGPLVPQLDDVDSTGQRSVGELGEVAVLSTGVGAEVEPGGGQTLADVHGGEGSD